MPRGSTRCSSGPTPSFSQSGSQRRGPWSDRVSYTASVPFTGRPSFRSGSASPPRAGRGTAPRRRACCWTSPSTIWAWGEYPSECSRATRRRCGPMRRLGSCVKVSCGRQPISTDTTRTSWSWGFCERSMAGADKVVAIHQPTFFPWLGYFNKIARADIFVVLDNVQFPKTGGTWLNRVRLLIDGRARWVTMPVVRRYRGVRLIREMLISDEPAWRRRLEQTLRSSYGRAACFDEVFP